MKRINLLGSIILILMTIIVVSLLTVSNGQSEKVGVYWWGYDVVDEEAVNARIYTPFPYGVQEFTIPNKLGGYDVTSITGKSYGTNGNENVFGIGRGKWRDSREGLVVSDVSKINLPDTLKEIGDFSFWDMQKLTNINIPKSLERIGNSAFSHTNIKNIELDGLIYISNTAFSDSSIEEVIIKNMDVLTGFGSTDSLKNVYIEGVNDIKNFGKCPNAEVHISGDVKRICRTAFLGMTDIYVDSNEEDVEIYDDDRFKDLSSDDLPYIHFKDGEKISVDLPEGVKIIDASTGLQILDKKYPRESNITLKLEQEGENNYTDYVVYMETDGQENKSRGKIVKQIDLKFDKEYTINNLQRNTKIYFQERKDGVDLSLRQYLDSINGEKIAKKREPVVKTTYGDAKYFHTKNIMYSKKADKLTYGIRVYNEGTTPCTAREITFYIPEGLKYNNSSEINLKYQWKISEDGRIATTNYLSEKNIDEYTIYDISYEQLNIDLIVDVEPKDEVQRLVTMAAITNATGTDVDSNFEEIENPNDSTYKQEESEKSNENSYILGKNDSTDFENIYIANSGSIPYSLIIKKIDGVNSELLNGATFDLLDENKKTIKTGVTAEGGVIDFGTIYTFGLTKNTYYVKETSTPEGYRNVFKYLIQVDLVNEYTITEGLQPKIELNVLDIDIDTSRYEEIEIGTKEELKNIQSNSEKKYVLTKNIDLSGENWTPLNVENVILDGKNHKITGLTINGNDQAVNKLGLFGTYSGIIENLTIEGENINITKTASESDIDAVGSFVGYAGNVIFKNCNVTGKIETNIKNVGGFVGHTKADSLVVVRDCENNATITADSHNIGGIVGCAFGPVKIYNTTNKAAIDAKSYNAGGLVGYISPTGYKLTQIVPEYNNSNKQITIAIKNHSIKNTYKLRIEKIDKDGNLLNGAVFKVLNNNKEEIEGYEEINATNGIIEFETSIVDSIGTDVYYLKEIKAPEGYELLNNNYIKIAINKKWDTEKSSYYMEVEKKELTEEEFENDEISPRNNSQVKTDLTYSGETNNVVLNIAELDIRDSSNEGVITNSYEYTVTGGLVGSSKGRTEIYNSSNKAQVTANGGNAKTAGIIAEIIKNNRGNTRNAAIISNCSNLAHISGTAKGEDKKKEGTTSGILAFSRIEELNMEGNENSGIITGVSTATSGIAGNALGEIIIQKCINKGEVTTTELPNSESSESAGILAKNIFLKDEEIDIVDKGTLRISECTNEGNISGNVHVAGILACSDADSITINECTTRNCNLVVDKTNLTFGKGSVSGIVGYAVNHSINIENCNVDTVNLNNEKTKEYTKTAGVLAEVGSMMGNNIYLYNENKPQEVIIKNCDVTETYLTSAIGDSAGIVAFGGYGNDSGYDITVDISKCDVTGLHIKNQGSSANDSSSGIYGQGYNIKNVNINECNVINSEITGSSKVAGVYGFGYASDYGNSISIKNTNVSGCTIENPLGENTSGVMAGLNMNSNGAFSKGQVIIDKCKVYDSEITGGKNTSGIFNVTSGGSGENYPDGAKVTVTQSTVEDTTVVGHGICTGGIVGYSNIYCNISGSNVINSEIKNDGNNGESNYYGGPNTGGIAGHIFNGAEISNCNVTNTNVISTLGSNHGQTGGIAGYITSNPQIVGCNVKGISKKVKIEGHGTQVGGITCFYLKGTEGNDNIAGCTVDNVEVVHEVEISSGTNTGTSTGGIISMDGYNLELSGCTFTNSSIVSNAQNVGGIIGIAGVYSNGTKAITGCTVKSVEITSGDERTGMPTELPGTLGGVIGLGFKTPTISGITVEDVKLQSSSDHIGGIMGTTRCDNTLQGVTINGLNITHTNTATNAAIRGVGGILGVSKFAQFNSETNNKLNVQGLSMKNVNIDVAAGSTTTIHAGGIAGQTEIGTISIVDYNNGGLNGIHIKNLTNGTTGGLVGYLGGKETIELSGLAMSNSTVEGNNAGGMIGLVQGASTISINEPKLDNIEVKGAAGIVAVVDGDTTLLNINGVMANTLKVENTNGQFTGGLIGFANKPTVNGGTITDLTVNGTSNVGGIVGLISGIMQKPNSQSNIQNIVLTSSEGNRNTISTLNAQNVGIVQGFGRVNTENITINNVDITNTANTGMGANVGVIGNADTGSNISGITLNDSTITSDKGIVGGIVGVFKGTLNDSTVNRTNITVPGNASIVGGIVGLQDKQNSTSSQITNCNVNETHINAENANYSGGIAGYANGAIKESSIKASEINSPNATGATGGILGHGSNMLGSDTLVEKCNVIDTDVTGNNNVGGIVGGAVAKIQDCIIGGIQKSDTTEAETFEEGEYALTIKGNSNIGGIIGDAGIISSDRQVMILLQGNKIENTFIEGKNMVDKIIAIRNSFVSGYKGQQTEKISDNLDTNCTVHIVEH